MTQLFECNMTMILRSELQISNEKKIDYVALLAFIKGTVTRKIYRLCSVMKRDAYKFPKNLGHGRSSCLLLVASLHSLKPL